MDKKKKWFGIIVILCWLIAVVISLGIYSEFVSKMIYEESSHHLTEIYVQVAKSVYGIVEEKWKILKIWDTHLAHMNDSDEMRSFLQEQKEEWKFTDFYFISSDGNYYSPDGENGFIDLKDQMARLVKDRESVAMHIAFPGRTELQVYAVPSKGGIYQGFHYDVIAISYDNSALLHTLDVSAFDGMAGSYVVSANGRVMIDNVGDLERSTFNLLAYLESQAQMDKQETAFLKQEFLQGNEGVVTFSMQGEKYYLVYQPVGVQDQVVVGLVPMKLVNVSMSRVQRVTMIVFICIVALSGLLMLLFLVMKNREKLKKKDMDILYREELFGTLSNNVNDIFLLLDGKDFTLNYVSPNICVQMGIKRQDIKSCVRDIEQEFGIIQNLKELAVAEHRQWEHEYTNKETGEIRWYQLLAYRADICDCENCVVVLSDRTQEKRMNQSLLDALELAKSANEAKSNFLANMSHDIRTPMNAIIGFTTLLEHDVENPDKVREYTRKLSVSGRHLMGLINDILDMSKIEAGQTTLQVTDFCITDILEEMQSIILPQTRARQQTFEVTTEGDIPGAVQGDKVRLNQILLNLLSNAVKYTQEGGTISLRLEAFPGTLRHHTHFRFIVADNGYGMSGEYIQTIFDPFSRENTEQKREIKGTGLGMAITKNIVDLMGGTIEVESTLGEGSVFTVNLELLNCGVQRKGFLREDNAIEGSEPGAKHSLSGLHVLCAEDNEINAQIIMELLRMEGASCELTVNGQETLTRFESAPPGTFDLIFMDIQMPVMNGYEAAKRIRICGHADCATIPIIAMTANAFDEDVRRALDAGMNAHMGKPMDMEKLKHIVGELLGRTEI